jgi:hypothetical protein
VRTTRRRPRRRRRRCRRPGAAAASRHRVVVAAHPLRYRAATWAAENGRSELAGRLHHYAAGRVCCNVGGQERPLPGRSRSPGPLVTRSSWGREVRRSHDRQPAVPAAAGLRGTRDTGRPCRRAQASPARHGIRTVPRRRGRSPVPAPGRYQRPWITVPLCSVTTFLALPVQSMKAGRSCQVSRASLQCSTTPAGDA